MKESHSVEEAIENTDEKMKLEPIGKSLKKEEHPLS
jgi:hypothetical protein